MSIITVTSANNSGSGSLRETIARAKAGDTIKFAANLANKTITLTSGQIELNKNLIIDGSGAANITISGNKASRIFNTTQGIRLTLKSLNFVNGRAVSSDPKSEIRGGAINLNNFSRLTVSDCKFEDNVSNRGGAIHVGRSCVVKVSDSTFDNNDGSVANNGFSAGAIAAGSTGLLSIKSSRFTNNRGVSGGAIYKLLGPLVVEDSVFLKNKSSYGGGAIYTDGANIDGPKNDSETVGGTIRISGSRFEGNESRRDGGAINLYIYYPDKAIIEDSIIINNKVKPDSKGIALGGGVRANGNITIRNVTFANNIAEGQGGGLWLDGYVNSKNARATVENSTFSGNKASSTKGYGGAITINPSASANIDITNSTVVDNYAQTYGGAFWIVGKQIATLTNSIVANNKANNSSGLAQQVAFQLRDGGGNIEFPSPVNSKNKKVTAGSLIANPKLGSLQTINGVLVRPILAGSPAIDEGVTTKAPKTDIRGFNRDSQPDVGAYEYGAKAASSLTSTATQATTTSSTSSLKKATSGNDVIIGTSVSDRIIGLAGADKLTGREGNDQFVYTNISDRGDTITDFEIGKDKIVFTQLLDSLSYTGTNAIADGYVKIIQGNISNNFSVQIDVDGSTGNESFSPFITVDVKGTGTLNNASNFVF